MSFFRIVAKLLFVILVAVAITVIARCPVMRFTCTFTSDAYLFQAVQFLLVVSATTAFFCDWWWRKNLGGDIIRAEHSMARFYGAYSAFIGILLAIDISVDYAASRRTFFVILDVLLVSYLCLFNAWFRNKLIGWPSALAEFEKRNAARR